jgi:peptide/nickel transport system permease protein/oligopeptide transport system permease protein
MVFVAFSAGWIERYPPDQVFSIPNPDYDPVLAEKAKTDAFIRLQYPPEKFIESGRIVPQNPSAGHWLGTDLAGRDLYSRIVHGAARSLGIGLGGALFVLCAGMVFGVTSAYFGGAVDLVIQRFTDALMAFPGLVLLLLIIQIVQEPNEFHLMFALGVGGLAPMIRIIRGIVLTIRQEPYVLAAQVVGATDLRVMVRHVIPQIIPLIMIGVAISIGGLILAESSLSFLGQGSTTAISWGQMVNDGRKLLPASPAMSLVSGGAIAITVLGFNLVGDALRDVLDPRMRGRGSRTGF